MRYSSPSILISAPEYLPNRMRSPAFTSSATRSPVSSSLPLPTAFTSACCGFSLAESGIMIPPTFCSPLSRFLPITPSCKVRKSMPQLYSALLIDQNLRQYPPHRTARRLDFQHRGQCGSDIVHRDRSMVLPRANVRAQKDHRHVRVVAVRRRVPGALAGAHHPVGVRNQLHIRAPPRMKAVGRSEERRVLHAAALHRLLQRVN